jgi:hypothetical protein
MWSTKSHLLDYAAVQKVVEAIEVDKSLGSTVFSTTDEASHHVKVLHRPIPLRCQLQAAACLSSKLPSHVCKLVVDFAADNGRKRTAVISLLLFLGVNSDMTLPGSMEGAELWSSDILKALKRECLRCQQVDYEEDAVDTREKRLAGDWIDPLRLLSMFHSGRSMRI